MTTALAGLTLGCVGCGQASQQQRPNAGRSVPSYLAHAHPQAVEPVAGSAAASPADAGGPASVSVDPSPGSRGLAQPVSDSEVRKELSRSGLTGTASRATLTPSGLAIPPRNAPPAVQAMIESGNTIAHLPYRFGGGHGTFQDTAYDCSGSLSYVFAAAGMLNTTVVSGQLMSMGDAGPGRWVTIYANEGHTFAIIAGLRFDTVALAETGSRWSNQPPTENVAAFAVRHPPGY